MDSGLLQIRPTDWQAEFIVFIILSGFGADETTDAMRLDRPTPDSVTLTQSTISTLNHAA